MFGGPIYTVDKKPFGDFPTPLLMPKKTKTSLPPIKIVKEFINELISKQELTSTAQSLVMNTHPRTSVVYFKPKNHKSNNPSRPIVFSCSCRTELISANCQILTSVHKKTP